MFFPDRFNYLDLRLVGLLAALVFLSSCRSTRDQQEPPATQQTHESVFTVRNGFSVPGQKPPVPSTRSIQLFRGSAGNAPIIRLNSSDRLTLRFDQISTETGLFRVRISHHDADWTESQLVPNLFTSGFTEDYIQTGTPSRFQNPQFFSYSYTFPNQNMRVTRSGNYMMHVYNQETNEYLFAMPFLVYEGTGEVTTSLEELFNLDPRFLRHHQLFARYRYEDTGLMPHDLQILFVQNQFWGRAREANQQDFSEAGTARMYIRRQDAFVGTYEFLELDLSRIDQYSLQIVDFRQDLRLPRVTLDRDVVNLNFSPRLRNVNRLSSPSTRSDARYALVRFRLDIPHAEQTSDPIYVVGGFNNWTVDETNRMVMNPESGYFTGEAIIKEGTYTYKYVTVSDGVVDDLRFDASFASTRQEYHTLVYRRDQTFQTDRLIAVDQFFSRD